MSLNTHTTILLSSQVVYKQPIIVNDENNILLVVVHVRVAVSTTCQQTVNKVSTKCQQTAEIQIVEFCKSSSLVTKIIFIDYHSKVDPDTIFYSLAMISATCGSDRMFLGL